MSTSIRFVSILALAAMAAASQAISFNFTGTTASGVNLDSNGFGTFTSTGSTVSTPSPFLLLNSAVVTLAASGSTAVFSSTTQPSIGTFTINFIGTPDNTTNAGTSALSSNATSFSGTGVFSPFTQGNLSVTSNTNTATHSNLFTVTGNITPEPTSFAALGVGALALIRRRRKA